MVEAVNATDNKQPNVKGSTKKRSTTYYLAPQSPIRQDTVNISQKPSSPPNTINKLELASIIVGGFASTAFLIVMLKSLFPVSKNRALLKEIKKANIPDNVRKKLLLEYDKFKKSFMDVDNSQNYIKNVLRLNWSKTKNSVVDIGKAKRVLDEEHVGLDKVKEEILSFIKTQNYNARHGIDNNGPVILCLDGPPGVGKTSIAESVAKAMDKPFERISLAGVSHKSFIKGTERLYKGSEPGQIIKAIQNAGVNNPVILIDEIDKMGSSLEHGDPAFALLDILEQKQCKNFTDEYIELPYDLSNVTFVITSNDINRIPKVLKDRLSIIHIPPYTKQEKINIGNFNIQKLINSLKINSSLLEFSNDGVEEIINQTQDQGARRTIENVKYVLNKVVQLIETNGPDKKIIVNKNFVSEALKNRQESTLSTEDKSGSIDSVIALLVKLLNKN